MKDPKDMSISELNLYYKNLILQNMQRMPSMTLRMFEDIKNLMNEIPVDKKE